MASIMGLHLQYRLWIAELNADINALRIFDDYLADIALKNNTDNVINHIKDYNEQFLSLRSKIDDLKHEMHINKMALAAVAKKANPSLRNIQRDLKHAELRKLYKLFRKTFDRTKRSFQKFESRLMK